MPEAGARARQSGRKKGTKLGRFALAGGGDEIRKVVEIQLDDFHAEGVEMSCTGGVGVAGQAVDLIVRVSEETVCD